MAETPILHALRYPLKVDALGGRMAEETDYEAYVRQLIRQVLLTSPGERINRPDFGAGIRRMVFAPNSPEIAAMTQTFVYQALSRWLPTVIKVEDIKVTADDATMFVDVRYLLIQRGESRELREEVTF
jgi:phage baseplate assembly protein W